MSATARTSKIAPAIITPTTMSTKLAVDIALLGSCDGVESLDGEVGVCKEASVTAAPSWFTFSEELLVTLVVTATAESIEAVVMRLEPLLSPVNKLRFYHHYSHNRMTLQLLKCENTVWAYISLDVCSFDL